MSKFFTDNGFLSEYGKEDFEMYLDKEINIILNTTKNENELRILGSLICKRVQDKVLEHITRAAQEENKLNAMTDEQFYSFLEEKYGDAWAKATLTAAEIKRVPRLTSEEIHELLNKRTAIIELEHNTSFLRHYK